MFIDQDAVSINIDNDPTCYDDEQHHMTVKTSMKLKIDEMSLCNAQYAHA